MKKKKLSEVYWAYTENGLHIFPFTFNDKNTHVIDLITGNSYELGECQHILCPENINYVYAPSRRMLERYKKPVFIEGITNDHLEDFCKTRAVSTRELMLMRKSFSSSIQNTYRRAHSSKLNREM